MYNSTEILPIDWVDQRHSAFVGEFVDDYGRAKKPEKPFVRSEIKNNINLLGLHKRSYVVIGGASLVLRDIKPTTTDIDILVSATAFDTMLKLPGATEVFPPAHARLRGANNTTVHIEQTGTPPISAYQYLSGNGYYPMSFASIYRTAEMINGIPVAALQEVIASKQALGREKDIADLGRIATVTGYIVHIPNPNIVHEEEY